MVIDQMITTLPQSQDEAGAEQMFSNDIAEKLSFFLLTCRTDGLSPASVIDYQKKLRIFTRFLDSQGIEHTDKVTSIHVRMFLDRQRDTCNSISVHGYYRSVKRFFNWLVEEELLPKNKNPMDKVKPPRVERKVIQPFSDEQISKLLILCDQRTFIGSRNQTIILIFYDTGVRLREMADIQLKDIDPDRELIKIMGKGARERFVRIGVKTQHALARYMMMRRMKGFNLPYLWVSEEGELLLKGGIRLIIRNLGKRAGLKGVRCSPHTFRHSFGTMTLRNGADIRETQVLLGHSTLNMTLRYVATIDSEQAIKGHRGTPERRGFSPVDRMK